MFLAHAAACPALSRLTISAKCKAISQHLRSCGVCRLLSTPPLLTLLVPPTAMVSTSHTLHSLFSTVELSGIKTVLTLMCPSHPCILHAFIHVQCAYALVFLCVYVCTVLFVSQKNHRQLGIITSHYLFVLCLAMLSMLCALHAFSHSACPSPHAITPLGYMPATDATPSVLSECRGTVSVQISPCPMSLPICNTPATSKRTTTQTRWEQAG